MRMTYARRTAAFSAIVATILASAASADEGMWTFDGFPTGKVRAAYGFAPDQAWLDRARNATARLTDGCSASLVSAKGLMLTNHHCVVGCAQQLSTERSDYVADGFLAEDRAKERQCPGQQAEILTRITDVTPKVTAAIGAATGAALVHARDAQIAQIEDAGCADKETTRCQVVTLYGGGQYKLYTYRKYSDVRLVFAPENAVAQFGGDPDNFNFPRYGLDAAFLRIYEGGRPVATPQHLAWSPRAPRPGEPVFVVGNPGSTQRLFTQSQIATRRDLALPITGFLLSEQRGRLISAMDGDAEKTRTGSDELFGVENSFKVYYGRWRALTDPAFAARLAAGERDLRAKVAADPALVAKIGDPWAQIATAMDTYRELWIPYTMLEAHAATDSKLLDYASALVRAAAERAKPDAERLPGYTNSALPLLRKQLLDEAPVYPWLERLELGLWLTKLREYLTVDDPRVKAVLGSESPEALATRAVAGSKLADPKVRAALLDGGMAAVRASDDPMIRLALANEPAARAVLTRFRNEVEAPVTAAQAKLAQARFAVYGTGLYPDATFTARVSYGSVKGWSEPGRTIQPTTNFAGLYDRATGAPPFALPPRWLAAKGRIDQRTVLDFSTTNDVVGGNSGSPAIARDGSVIGALFDGNIHSHGGGFGYDPILNRSVVVSAGAVQEALKSVYRATALLAELGAK